MSVERRCSQFQLRNVYLQLYLAHDVRNTVTLRNDLRLRWDTHAFVFIPDDEHLVADCINYSHTGDKLPIVTAMLDSTRPSGRMDIQCTA